MEETINYLINFLAGSSGVDYSSTVGYTANQDLFPQYKIVIIPSSFFEENTYGKPNTLPSLPLQEINNIPLLFGSSKVEKIKTTLVIHADIIASAYFLLTRYEEWIRIDCRDIHGRFPGKESLPFRAGFIHRPIVDEYGKLLQTWLKESNSITTENKNQLSKVYLTHDVDQVSQYRSLRGFAGGIFRSIAKRSNEFSITLMSFFGRLENDSLFTFPWIFDENKKLKHVVNIEVESIFFFKSSIKHLPEDKPCYNLFSKDIQSLFKLCTKNNAQIGLHTSFYSGDDPSYIPFEKNKLEKACDKSIQYNRHHYLRSKEPMDMGELIDIGITDDFTMGYADIAGFRLGTCKPVKWINLQTKKVSTLNLHPLTIMDCTLDDKRYMNLNYADALSYSKALIDKTQEFGGELVLLWHNTSFVENSWHKKLYVNLLDYIKTKTTHEHE